MSSLRSTDSIFVGFIMNDFTLNDYMRIVQALHHKDLPIFGVAEWLRVKPKKGALIRHDVDRRPSNALEMAKAEAAAGVFTTYYFRVIGSANNHSIMRAVAELGHEVGYHYEDLALAKGNKDLAKQLFSQHLAELRAVVPIVTVAMHGSPLSLHNNLEIWEFISLSEYELIGEALQSVDYSGAYYFTDTGRGWDSSTTNFRDRPSKYLHVSLPERGTKGLLDFIEHTKIIKTAFSVHPERWDKSASGWCYQFGRDLIFNSAKRIIALTR